MTSKPRIPPGRPIGILGGGQLGRMTALAAARLGYPVHVFCQKADEPGAQVAARAFLGDFSDEAALAAFAKSCAVVTLEWENLPLDALAICARHAPVHPGADVLAICQDRLREKDFCRAQGIGTADFRAVKSADDARAALKELGAPCILKTTRMGYDGKGQVKLTAEGDADAAWHSLNTDEAIAEAFVPFQCELSIIIARAADGRTACFPLVENEHRDHILWQTTAPAMRGAAVAQQAQAIAEKLAQALNVVGVLCVELFLTKDDQLLVNELAPRPHNSGHWTMDACACSQFEQLVRAITGLPLGNPAPHHAAVMQNLIGEAYDLWPDLAADPSACLHLYGKSKVRFGRKMGHVTRLGRPLGH